ncbi:MAG: hypothetical protein AB1485_00055 [Candidatus Thermoplasmatota archaeon]
MDFEIERRKDNCIHIATLLPFTSIVTILYMRLWLTRPTLSGIWAENAELIYCFDGIIAFFFLFVTILLAALFCINFKVYLELKSETRGGEELR